jgi:hypothetical protein
MAVLEARMNLVMDRLIELFLAIDGDASKYKTAFQTVEEFLGAADLDKPLPGLFIEIGESGEDQVSGPAYEETVPLRFVLATEDVAAPGRALRNAVADFKRVVRAQGGNLTDRDGTLLGQQFWALGYLPVLDPNAAGAGKAAAVVPGSIRIRTDALNP